MTERNLNSSIIQYGKQTIYEEINEVSKLADYIDDAFVSVVQLVLSSKGRVIMSGIGKSAIIGQKIVATLNSTGTPAVFMHAADAIHGDLGIIQKDDIVFVISKSGNTPEIKALVPLVKQFGNPLIAIVGNTQSVLALSANYILNVTVSKEACPHNLAPTTSTTAQLLMGDALAVTLLKCRNFSSQDFSKYHPGGTLGKQLYLTIGELAAQNEKPAVDENAPIKEVIFEISKKRMGATAVVNQQQVIGMITDGDIRRMIEQTTQLADISAKDIMSLTPVTVDKNELAVSVVAVLREKKISQIIVLDQGEYYGMVHIHDFNKEGLL
jgi:arabinose-5-phosphate isomerase